MSDEVCKRFGENVKKRRKPRSQETMAGLIGCSRKHYMAIESGRVDVGIIMLKKIAAALNVSIEKLLD